MAEATLEVRVDANPEAVVEATLEASVDANPEAIVEVTLEAGVEANLEAPPKAPSEHNVLRCLSDTLIRVVSHIVVVRLYQR